VGDDAGKLVLDVASPTATLIVPLAGSGSAALDIKRFSSTHRVSVSKPKSIVLKLTVQNNGTIEGSANATVTGMQGGVQVYSESVSVTDSVGNGSTTCEFPAYIPETDGDILWTAVISDADPDDDVATTTTVVVP
jgi:hypothetical protein